MVKKAIVKAAKVVEASPQVIIKNGSSQVKGFIDFIKSQGVIGLAVGLVLGGAVTVLVKSLVDNVVMPPIGLLLGSAEGLKGLSWTMANTADGQPAVLYYGVFLNDFINFIVIALVVYLIVKILKVEKVEAKVDLKKK